MPYGHGAVNQQGIDHYNDVINTCLQYNVTPLVTLYHWDLPLALQNDYDGWNSERIIDDFVEYARVVYDAFGDRVKTWFTINERKCGTYGTPGSNRRSLTFHQPLKSAQSTPCLLATSGTSPSRPSRRHSSADRTSSSRTAAPITSENP